MSKNQKASAITHEDIQQAIVKFERMGGLVKKLIDEPTPLHTVVGNKWAMYESPFENGLNPTPN